MEDNLLASYPIDIHQHQSPNYGDTDTDTNTDQQQENFEIKPTGCSYYEYSDVGGSAKEGTSEIYEKMYPTLWFIKILTLLLLFQKVSLSFIFVFGTYVVVAKMMVVFYQRSSQTHIINNKPLK